MTASKTGSSRCSRAQSVCKYRSTDSTNSISAICGQLGKSSWGAGTWSCIGGGGIPSKGAAGLAASMACWICTTGTGPTRRACETPEGKTI